MGTATVRRISGPQVFRVGDAVEFWSGEGRWKPGIIDEVLRGIHNGIRICVGEGVHIIRKRKGIRLSDREVGGIG